MRIRGSVLLSSFLILLGVPALPAFSQDAYWSGQAQCQLTVQSQGYALQETQTWTISPGAPTLQGAFEVYPGTWSVTGQGSVQRPTLASQWTTNVAPMNGPIGVFIRASDNRLIVQSRHAQLVSPSGTVVKQVTGGQTNLATTEWSFPAIEDAANSTSVSGMGTIVVAGSLLPMQLASVSSTANCTWQFSKGRAVALGPAAISPLSTTKTNPLVGSTGVTTPATSGTTVTGSVTSLPQTPLAVSIIPAITQLNPASSFVGHILPVTITGQFTHFDQSTTKVAFPGGAGIDVESITVNSPTSVTASVSVRQSTSWPSPASQVDVLVTTGSESVRAPAAFSVVWQQLPVPVMLSPNSGQQGQTVTITVTGSSTNFVQGVTVGSFPTAQAIQLVPIGGVTVSSPTSATMRFTISPTTTWLGNVQLGLVTPKGIAEEHAFGTFTILPGPDSYGHFQYQATYVGLQPGAMKALDGQLASQTGEDWFEVDPTGSTFVISLQNVVAPSQFSADVISEATGMRVASVGSQTSTTARVSPSTAADFYYVRVRAATWDVTKPKYTITLTPQ